MNNSRRIFLRAALASSTVAVAVSAGLLTPGVVLAAWPKKAFEAKEQNAALTNLLGSADLTSSGDVVVKTPDIAENGAVVSITVEQKIPGAESISLLVTENPTQLAANFNLSKQASSFITCRVKMRQTSDVIAVVKADGKLYSGTGRVKVTLGGCGG